MKRRLTMFATAFEKTGREAGQPTPPAIRIASIPAGETVELVGAGGIDWVWVRWNRTVWSILLEAWNTAERVG